ncbi:MAG: DUF11 domain-containing protein, partial [Propionibacteriaceae bacterium]|nr:DUF11 domain-containing protein [Propionibacteriaceae bacterium]
MCRVTAAKRTLTVLLTVVLAVAATVFTTGQTLAATSAPFAVQFTTNANGAVLSIGNTLLTCADRLNNCTGAKNGAAFDNNYFNMSMLDVDTDAATFNSSSSDLNLPDGAQVLFAGLYWGARLTAGTAGGNTDHANQATANTVKFKVPGASSYENLTGTLLAVNTGSNSAYQSFIDVTSRVQTAGNGTYWGANVQAGTGADRYAGWALTLVYTAPGLPLRNLTVFQGFTAVSSAAVQKVTVSGFKAPLAGAVDAQLSMVAYEGDFAQTGDYTQLNNTQLATDVSPGSNFFNSTNTRAGQIVTSRNPNYPNMLGFDIKNLGISGAIPNGATSATFTFSSAGDAYFPGVLALAINLYAPDFSASGKSVANLTAGSGVAKPGDTLSYTLTYTNTGQDPSIRTISSDPLPAGLTYVKGSLVLMSGPTQANQLPLTDAAGDDLGEYDEQTRTIRVRLGSGASATAGGRLNVGDITYYQFQATIDASAGGTTLMNLAHLDYATGTTGVSAVYDTAPVYTPVTLLADVSIAKAMTPSPTYAGKEGTTTLTVRNLGPNTATNVVVTDQFPTNYVATAVTASNGANCSITNGGHPFTCNLGNLANNATVTITITGHPLSSSTDSTINNIATVTTASFDPNTSNNTAVANVPMTAASDLTVEKTPNPSSGPAGSTITYTITAENHGPSDATDVVITDTVTDPKSLVIFEANPTTTGLTCPTLTASGVQCSIKTLPAGTTAVVEVKAYIVPSVTVGTVIKNVATVSSPTVDPEPDNNTTTDITVAEAKADLEVMKTATASSYAGGQVTYQLTVENLGPSDAQNVVLEDALPAGFTPTSELIYDRGKCTITDNKLVCTI